MTLRILLADSSITTQRIGAKLLAAAGHEVVTVSDGLAALKKIAEQQLDVAFLDVYLPGRTGLEICRNMKASADKARIPVLLIASKVAPFSAAESIEAKADGFVLKPFQASCMIPLLEKLAEQVAPPEICRNISAPQLGAVNHPAPADTGPCTLDRTVRCASSHQENEICDVCGCINRKDALVCQRCDVPLPSAATENRR